MAEKLIIGIAANVTVEITGNSSKEIIQQAAFWGELPDKCPVCSAPLTFSYRDPKGFHYYGMRCLGNVAHETTFGQYQGEGKGLYYKRDWHEAQIGNGQSEERQRHARLDDDVSAAWIKAGRKDDLNTAVKTKYGRSLNELSIEEKEHILQSLTAI